MKHQTAKVSSFPGLSRNFTDKIDRDLYKALETTCRFNESVKNVCGVKNNYRTQMETYPNLWRWHILRRFPPAESLVLSWVSLLIFLSLV